MSSRKILLAWELGGGRGHVLILGWIARALRRRGYEPVLAVQSLQALESIHTIVAANESIQAPLWLGLLDYRATAAEGRSVTLGDLLADVGLRVPTVVDFMIRGWESVFARVDPAAVVAEFAPACLMAAKGRIPSIAVGDAFTLPPSMISGFPPLEPDVARPKHDEGKLVEKVNEALRTSGRAPIKHLPEIFSADRTCVGSFPELDPYAAFRVEPTAAPWLPSWDHTVPMTRAEIFGYFGMTSNVLPTILAAIAQAAMQGMTVRVHVPGMDDDARQTLSAQGVIVERASIPFDEIQRRTRLIASYGSFGLVSCALVAGIPQLVIPHGLAKAVHGRSVVRLGVGRALPLSGSNPLEAALLRQAIIEAGDDEVLAATAKRLAPDFTRRLEPRPAEIAAGFVDELT